jgi:flagellar hook assembly protein FlgD
VFTVNYALTDSAQVLFRVFNLQGVPLRTVDYGSQPSGNNVFTWDGHDDGGTLQSNGVYFFTVEAKSDFSGDQTFRQIVGVMR